MTTDKSRLRIDSKFLRREGYGHSPLMIDMIVEQNRVIDMYWWEKWRESFLKNESLLGEVRPLSDLMDNWGTSTLVVGSGPSAIREMKQIRRAKKLGWMIAAVDRAFEPLKENNIKPDVTFTGDAGESVLQMMNLGLTKSDRFACCMITPPEMIQRLRKGSVYLFSLLNPFSDFWETANTRLWPIVPRMRPGFSISHVAIEFAIHCHNKYIVTIGNELCWPTRKEAIASGTYCPTTLITRDDGVTAPSAFFKTASALTNLPRQHPEIRFINASGGLDRNWEEMSLEEILGGSK